MAQKKWHISKIRYCEHAIHRADVLSCERNLYVFVYSDDVVLLAHPLRQNMVGASFSRHPEDYGNEPVSVTVSNLIVEKALKDGSGWTDYPAEIPGTFTISTKHTYEKLFRHAGKNYIGCCGIW